MLSPPPPAAQLVFLGSGDMSELTVTAPPTIVMASGESQSVVSAAAGSSSMFGSYIEGDTTASRSGGKRNWRLKRKKTSQKIFQLAKNEKEKVQKASEANKSIDTSGDKRVMKLDMKLAKDFASAMEQFRKFQNLAILRVMAYKPVVRQNAQS